MRLAVIDSSNSGFDVDFGYDGQEMVLEGLSSSRTRRYVYGPGVDEPLVGYLVTPGVGTSRLWYHADERGSIARLSNDAGTPGGIGKFDEYGIGGTSRFRFTGQYWLGEANLLYYRARVYDPRLGRFLQPDPIGYGDGMNMYAYVGGDPVNGSDPLGLTKEERIVCTGTRRTNGCGGGGIASGMSGFSSAWPGGQAPTGADSLANLGINTDGMSNAEIRALAESFLQLGEQLEAAGVSRNATLYLSYDGSQLSGSIVAPIQLAFAEPPPGIGHNGGPPIAEGRRILVRGALGGVIGVIVGDVFFPAPVGESEDWARKWDVQGQLTRAGTQERRDQIIKEYYARENARLAQERLKQGEGVLGLINRFLGALLGGN